MTRLSLLTFVLVISLLSCRRDQKEGSESNPSSKRRVDNVSVQSSEEVDRFTKKIERVLQQKLPFRHKMARIAADAALCLENDDKAGFDEIAKTLSDLQVSGLEFGIELMAVAKPMDRAKLLAWLDAVPDQTIRYNATAGSLGQLITADPKIATEMIGMLNNGLRSMKDQNNVVTLEEMVWLTAGRLLIEDGGITKATTSTLSELTNDKKLLESLAEGVASAAAKSVNAGKDIGLLHATIAGLPNDLRSTSLERIVARMNLVNEVGVESATSLIGLLKTYPSVSNSTFYELGTKLGSETFFSNYVARQQEFSERDHALVKGWASQWPENAFQKAVDSSSELAPTVFEAWIEADSIAASSKLAEIEDSTTKIKCISKLCEYLVSKNAFDEANEWLKVLPEFERLRIQELLDMHDK